MFTARVWQAYYPLRRKDTHACRLPCLSSLIFSRSEFLWVILISRQREMQFLGLEHFSRASMSALGP